MNIELCSMEAGKRPNCTAEGTIEDRILSLIVIKSLEQIIFLLIQIWFKMYLAVPIYILCIGSIINVWTGSKYGNCSKEEYQHPNSDSLRSLEDFVEHARMVLISSRCFLFDLEIQLALLKTDQLPFPNIPVPKLE